MDLEPPEVKILSPTPGEVVYGIVEIEVEARDNKKVSHINLYLDENHVKSFDENLFTYTWDLSKLSTDAEHTLKARAYDAENNWNETEVSFWGYANLPEVPLLLSPEEGESITTIEPELDWSDVVNSQLYHLQIDDNEDFSSPFIDYNSIIESNYSISMPLKNNDYFWRVCAKYTWNIWGDWSAGRRFIINTMDWVYHTGSSIESSPAIGIDRTIYFVSSDGFLYALYRNGHLRWKYNIGSNEYSSPAIDSDGTIIVGSGDGFIYAVHSDGTLKWRHQTNARVISSPAIAVDGSIYIGSDDHYLYALNSDGTLKWKFETISKVQSSPAIDGNRTIYVGSDAGYLYAISSNGELKWKYYAGCQGTASASIDDDGTIYIGSTRGNALYALTPSGNLKWRHPTSFFPYKNISPTIDFEGNIYFTDFYFVYSINSNGFRNWGKEIAKRCGPPTVGSDATLYFCSFDLNDLDPANNTSLLALNLDGTIKKEYQIGNIGSYSPAIGVSGAIYVGLKNGSFLALEGFSSNLANSPWPRFRHDNQNTGNARFYSE